MISLNMGSLTGKTTAAKTDIPDKGDGITVPKEVASATVPSSGRLYSSDTATTVIEPSTLSVEQATTDLSSASNAAAFATTAITNKGFPCDPKLSTAYVSPSKKTSLVSPIQVGSTTVTSIPKMFPSTVRVAGRIISKSSREYTILTGFGAMAMAGNTATAPIEQGIAIETLQFFAAMGCTVQDDPDKLYTMVRDQTDQTQISNPNIETGEDSKSDYGGIATAEPQKTFPSSSDPFYEESTRTTPTTKSKVVSAITKRVQLGEKSVRIAADIATINTGKEYDSTLKQFKKTETKKQVITHRSKSSSGLGLTKR
tara:strand:+ start:13043 stop:13981 length:939 start_codon:yes stop_codon:yes gene_type:complete